MTIELVKEFTNKKGLRLYEVCDRSIRKSEPKSSRYTWYISNLNGTVQIPLKLNYYDTTSDVITRVFNEGEFLFYIKSNIGFFKNMIFYNVN